MRFKGIAKVDLWVEVWGVTVVCHGAGEVGQGHFGVDAAMEIKENHQEFTAASEDISAARQKLMLLVTAVK
nr:hypothetical protein [Tanacetum cinerariifolium]